MPSAVHSGAPGSLRPAIFGIATAVKRFLLVLVGLTTLAVILVGVGLLWAHVSLRGERSPLPAADGIAAILAGDPDHPRALRWTNSASQDMPRSGVLDPALDPTPDAPYRMSHPSFILEWDDGRILLVDVGMTPSAAVAFGEPSELVAGARPMEPHRPTGEQLGPRARDVEGVVFSHLHTDHVEGITAMCEGRDRPLRVFGTKGQLVRTNYTTKPGLALLQDAPCVELVPIEGSGPLLEIPGFPGVRVIEAAGHTPGSQIVVAEVAGSGAPTRFAFGGDIANARDGIRHDIPKPWLYSLLVVPEDTERLGELRRFLRTLHQNHDFTVLVPHDELAIERAGVLRWTS